MGLFDLSGAPQHQQIVVPFIEVVPGTLVNLNQVVSIRIAPEMQPGEEENALATTGKWMLYVFTAGNDHPMIIERFDTEVQAYAAMHLRKTPVIQ